MKSPASMSKAPSASACIAPLWAMGSALIQSLFDPPTKRRVPACLAGAVGHCNCSGAAGLSDRSQSGPQCDSDDERFFSSIETHFKVNIPNVTDSVARDLMRKIRLMYNKIQKVLTVIATDRVVGNPGSPETALTPLGGIDNPSAFITIGRDFHNSNANMRAAVLIHEGAISPTPPARTPLPNNRHRTLRLISASIGDRAKR